MTCEGAKSRGGGGSLPPDIEGKSPLGFAHVAKALDINDIINVFMGMLVRRDQTSQ